MTFIKPPHKRGRWIKLTHGNEVDYFYLQSKCKCSLEVDHNEPRPKIIGGLTGRIIPEEERSPHENKYWS